MLLSFLLLTPCAVRGARAQANRHSSRHQLCCFDDMICAAPILPIRRHPSSSSSPSLGNRGAGPICIGQSACVRVPNGKRALTPTVPGPVMTSNRPIGARPNDSHPWGQGGREQATYCICDVITDWSKRRQCGFAVAY